MKTILILAVAYLASAKAAQMQTDPRQGVQNGRQGVRGNLNAEQQVLQLVGNSPHIVIVNKQLTGVAGYYVPVPNEILAAVSSPPSSDGASLISQLRQNGYLPIWNVQGNLIGLFIQSLVNNPQGNTEVSSLTHNLFGIGLTPIVNQQNQVIGLYTSSPTQTLGANQVGQLQQTWNQVGNNLLNNVQLQWVQIANNPLNNAQQQGSSRGNNPLSNGSQQPLATQWS